MDHRLETLTEKHFIGRKISMSFSNNRTGELWSSFMPLKKGIKNAVSSDLYSAEIYEPNFFENFDPTKGFDKWALVEVTDLNSIPDQMESITFPAGLYVVFTHFGPASEAVTTYNYIFKDWLPGSKYILDNRPHFAVMGKKYKPQSETSEEDIWIPVKLK